MKNIRDHGGLLESVVILFLMLLAFGIPEPAKAISDDASKISYDILETASNIEPIETTEKIEIAEIAENFEHSTYVAPVYRSSGYSAPRGNYVSILGRNLGLADGYLEDGRTLHTYDGLIAQYYSFYYGHNDILAGLGGLPVGATLSIYRDGVMHTYSVASVKTVPKNSINMKNMIHARDNGIQYSVSFMTCAGTPLPNRDATERVLLFANEI